MDVIKQIEVSSTNFWAGVSMTRAAFAHLKAEREITQAGKVHGDIQLMDELAVITKTPQERSADAADEFLAAGMAVYAAYKLAKDAEDPEAFYLKNVKTPLQVLKSAVEYNRNLQRSAQASALGIVMSVDTTPSDKIPEELLPLYRQLVQAVEGMEFEETVSAWVDENRNKVLDSMKNILDGARKRFAQNRYAGEPSELLEIRKYLESHAA